MDKQNGVVLSVNISEQKGQKKSNIEEVFVKENWGMESDAHSSDEGHRQISLLSLSSVEKMRAMGVAVEFGDFAENITLEGIEVAKLPIGAKLKVGEVTLEVTQIGKECINKGCAIKKQVGTCVMPKEGIFTRPLNSGLIKVGDSVEVI